MLIAVDSWPFIRGTLSPSLPGARRVRGPKYTPTLCLFVQLRRRRRSHRPSDHHSPLGQTFHSPSSPFPHTLGRVARVARKRPSLSLSFPTSGLHRLLLRRECSYPRCLSFSFIFFPTYLRRCILTTLFARFCTILSLRNDGHTDRPVVPRCRKLSGRQSHARAIPARTNLELGSARENSPFRNNA